MRAKIRRHLGFLFEEAAKPQKLLVTAAAAGKAAFACCWGVTQGEQTLISACQACAYDEIVDNPTKWCRGNISS
jgi:hypothetical protein